MISANQLVNDDARLRQDLEIHLNTNSDHASFKIIRSKEASLVAP